MLTPLQGINLAFIDLWTHWIPEWASQPIRSSDRLRILRPKKQQIFSLESGIMGRLNRVKYVYETKLPVTQFIKCVNFCAQACHSTLLSSAVNSMKTTLIPYCSIASMCLQKPVAQATCFAFDPLSCSWLCFFALWESYLRPLLPSVYPYFSWSELLLNTAQNPLWLLFAAKRFTNF